MTYFDRAMWNARPPSSPLSPWRKPVVAIAAHYEGSGTVPLDLKSYTAAVQQVQAYHMSGNAKDKYIDIAYNFVIVPNGDVYEGRGMDYQSGANGTTASNQTVLAVCFLLGPDSPQHPQPVTDAMKVSFLALEKTIQQEHPDAKTVHPHSDYFATACPGGPAHVWLAAGCPAPAGSVPPDATHHPLEEFDVLLTDVTGHLKTEHGEWLQHADGGVTTKAGQFYGSYPALDPKFHDNVNRRFYAVLEAREDGAPGYVLTSSDGGRYAFPV